EVLLPAHLARAYLQAGQVTVGPQSIQQRSVHRRRRASRRVRRLLLRGPDAAEARRPELLAILHVERLDELVLAALVAQHEEARADDGGRRVARADLLELPEQLRALLRPLFEQTRLLRDPVSLRAAPL